MEKACFSASKARCWSFTCMLVQKLPRELRDAIYEQFLEPNHRQAVLCSRHFDEWQVYEGHPERWDEPIFQGAYPPYFAYPYCVHETFALEVSEALYRVYLVQVKEVTLLAQFLRRDVFGTDCIPGDNIRCIEIEMSAPEGSSSHPPLKLRYQLYIDLLAPLLKLKRLKGLSIRLVIDSPRRSPPPNPFVRLKGVLAPTIHRLYHSGARVAWFLKNEDFGAPHNLDMPVRDYSQSMEEMTADIVANSVFVRLSI
jgi:hypothetical protein